MTGRFADPSATATLTLGACTCPGAPHPAGDWVELRTDLSGPEWATIAAFGSGKALEIIVVGWNFVDNEGEPVHPTPAAIARIDYATFKAIDDWVSENLKIPFLPNASAAPSRASTRASGSRTPTPTMGDSSTT